MNETTVPNQSEAVLLTEEQLAARLQASKRSVTDWRQRGRLPYILVGRLIRYSWPDVVLHLKKTSPR